MQLNINQPKYSVNFVMYRWFVAHPIVLFGAVLTIFFLLFSLAVILHSDFLLYSWLAFWLWIIGFAICMTEEEKARERQEQSSVFLEGTAINVIHPSKKMSTINLREAVVKIKENDVLIRYNTPGSIKSLRPSPESSTNDRETYEPDQTHPGGS